MALVHIPKEIWDSVLMSKPAPVVLRLWCGFVAGVIPHQRTTNLAALRDSRLQWTWRRDAAIKEHGSLSRFPPS